MTILALPPAVAASPLGRANPLAKLGAAVAVMLVLLPTVDPVTPTVLLAVTLVCVPLARISVGQLLRRAWPLLVAAASLVVVNAAFAAEPTGAVVVDFGPVEITTGGLLGGAILALRVIAIALPGVLAFMTTDPTDLADALVQQLKVSARFAYGTLAALRLLPLLGHEWRSIRLARRARGYEAGRSPVRAVRLFAGQVFALLVGAIRRGTRLATAMDARGFGSRPGRTYARAQSMRPADWGVLAAGAVIALGATALSVALGTWQLVLT